MLFRSKNMGENLKSISHTNVCRNINTHKERDRKSGCSKFPFSHVSPCEWLDVGCTCFDELLSPRLQARSVDWLGG